MNEQARQRWGVEPELGAPDALRWIVEHVPLILFQGPADTRRTVAAASGNWLDVVGRPAASFLSGQMGLMDVTHTDDLASVAREVHAASVASRRYQIGYRLRSPTGEPLAVWELGSAVCRRGISGAWLSGCIVGTHRAPPLQAQAATARTAAGLAHDLRNVLAVVSGAAELVSGMGGPGQADDPVAAVLEGTQSAGRLASQLVRLLHGRAASTAFVDLNEVVERMEPVLRALAGGHVLVQKSLEPDLFATAADPVHLDQLLLNLVVNAVEAMPSGGTLHVNTANVLATQSRQLAAGRLPPGEYVMLSVSDTGMGIPEQAVPSLFDPSYSTKGKRGLGLASVLGIAQGYSGAVDLQTAPGRGSTFYVYLPRVTRLGAHPVSQWCLR
ncbi:MAG: PAS domain-containing protein [Polyangiaceae bacterium]|nr:PAS domain-containing protein [Polyangiaceae bacterium]